MNNDFNAKILLFGEYGIIKGAKGLALPFPSFSGELTHRNDPSKPSLDKIVNHINRSKILKKELHVDKLVNDLKSGLSFHSNIPQGYGLGSSGAVCAAIFSQYSKNYDRHQNYDSDELGYLQELLGIIESYYHGTSSGLDPLISFFSKPILIHRGQRIEFIDFPNLEILGQFYLLDTQIERKTSPLVHQFLKDYSEQSYQQGINKFIELNNLLIENTLEGDKVSFQENFRELSRIQYLYFDKMIPTSVKEVWLSGLESKDYFIKLCGAGGGGFFMVYTPTDKVPLDHTLIKFS